MALHRTSTGRASRGVDASWMVAWNRRRRDSALMPRGTLAGSLMPFSCASHSLHACTAHHKPQPHHCFPASRTYRHKWRSLQACGTSGTTETRSGHVDPQAGRTKK